MKQTLNKTEYNLLLAIITGNFDDVNTNHCKPGDRLAKAKESLVEKGFLRVNGKNILEINLSDNYLKQIGNH